MLRVQFLDLGHDGLYEVFEYDEVEGEFYPVTVVGPWSVLPAVPLDEVRETVAETCPEGCEWEVRDADYQLVVFGRHGGE